MKKTLRILLFLPVVLALGTALTWADDAAPVTAGQPATVATPAAKAKPTSKKKAAKAKYIYVCPMGDYTGTKPGKCPNCGMDLVKQKVSDSKPATTTGSGQGM